MRLVQLTDGSARSVALVVEPDLVLLDKVKSVFELASLAIKRGIALSQLVTSLASGERVSYDDVYECRSQWKLLAPIDYPNDPQKVLVAGTGLTHLGSARERQAMHAEAEPQKAVEMTDSMRMFEWGREKGRAEPGRIGIAPEWFYKGDGSVLRAPF